MKIAAIMMTMDRSPRHNYLASSIASMIASGMCDDSRVSFSLFHSGKGRSNLDIELIQRSCATLHEQSQLDHFNLGIAKALRLAAEQNADYVLFFEDDVHVAHDFPDFVCSQLALEPTAVFLDFATYFQEVETAYLRGERFVELNAAHFYGTQCFCMPTQHAISFSDNISKNQSQRAGFADTWIQYWLADNALDDQIMSSVPSAVQHVGRDSNHSHSFIRVPAFKDEIERLKPLRTNQYAMCQTVSNGFFLNNGDIENPLHLNFTAQLIYLYCDGDNSIADIENAIRSHVYGDRYQLNQQIRQCLATLIEHSAIRYVTQA